MYLAYIHILLVLLLFLLSRANNLLFLFFTLQKPNKYNNNHKNRTIGPWLIWDLISCEIRRISWWNPADFT